jgi:hypothetical protein
MSTREHCSGFKRGKACPRRFDCQLNKLYWKKVFANQIHAFKDEWNAPFDHKGNCDLFIKIETNETNGQK